MHSSPTFACAILGILPLISFCQLTAIDVGPEQNSFKSRAAYYDVSRSDDSFRPTYDLTAVERPPPVDKSYVQRNRCLYPFGAEQLDLELPNRPNFQRQVDLDFYFPFYGFRYNYSIISPNGLVAFSEMGWLSPPYQFPNPKWPQQRDPSFIAAYFADATYQYVGEQQISHVWHRIIHRPTVINLDRFGNRWLTRHSGFTQDSSLLDRITDDIRQGMIGTRGFRADYALVVTWERMGYGGAPKIVTLDRYQQAIDWQNTFQVVLATDEIRSFVMFNYDSLNWTSSLSAGSLSGRGGLQTAIVGFNGGNGTGFHGLPYTLLGDVYKLDRFSSAVEPGRWVYRVDEQITAGGCSNESTGVVTISPNTVTMLGGAAVNISGPCIREGDAVILLYDMFAVNCVRGNMGHARCVLPMLTKVGSVIIKMSTDGGVSFPYDGAIYVAEPIRAVPDVSLVRDVVVESNNWDRLDARQLSLSWSSVNLTTDSSALVDIELWGYWEDMEGSSFAKIGTLVKSAANSGSYSFSPESARGVMNLEEAGRYKFGAVRVAVPSDDLAGYYFSALTPFMWLHVDQWKETNGPEWAMDLCKEWFDADGREINYMRSLHDNPCPCTYDQAVLDIGRFMPVDSCNEMGDVSCDLHRGSKHCIMSIRASWTGSQQVCCYDPGGWLTFSDDYDVAEQLRFASPGVSWRAHFSGAPPYLRPPRVPSLSHWYHDRMPYHMCCHTAQHCEFYFWRRPTSGCQNYVSPAAGYVLGTGHFRTFDGVKYTFTGKGIFPLVSSDHTQHRLTVQIRMEQPEQTPWSTDPNVTVVTGVAIQENSSDLIEVTVRPPLRRWRQRTEVTINGGSTYFDGPDANVQTYNGWSAGAMQHVLFTSVCSDSENLTVNSCI